MLRKAVPLGALARKLRAEAPAFVVAWIAPTLAFFSVSQSKLPAYILPVFPALAVGVAAVLDRALRERSGDAEGGQVGSGWSVSGRVGSGRVGSGRAGHGWLYLAPLVAPLLILAGVSIYVQAHGRELSGLPTWAEVRPVFAAVAALGVAASVAGWALDRSGRVVGGVAASATLWAVAWFVLMTAAGRSGTINEASHLVRVLRREGADAAAVYNYRCYLRGLPFYLKHPIHLVEPSEDDIELGRTRHPDADVFPSHQDLLAALRGEARVFVVMPARFRPRVESEIGRPLVSLARTARYELVSNRAGR